MKIEFFLVDFSRFRNFMLKNVSDSKAKKKKNQKIVLFLFHVSLCNKKKTICALDYSLINYVDYMMLSRYFFIVAIVTFICIYFPLFILSNFRLFSRIKPNKSAILFCSTLSCFLL